MTTYAAEDFEAIRRRTEELQAERDLALTGSSVPVPAPVDIAKAWAESLVPDCDPYAKGWPYTAAADYDPA